MLAGWTLATPPIDFDAAKAWTKPTPWPKGYNPEIPVRDGMPRSKWSNVQVLDTAAECEDARRARQKERMKPLEKRDDNTLTLDEAVSFAEHTARQEAECVSEFALVGAPACAQSVTKRLGH